MKTVQLEELGALAEDVRNGETIEVVDGDTPIATVMPKRKMTDEEILDKLEREGKIKRGRGKLPDDFFTRPRPKFDKSVLEQLLEDRRSRDY